jgi:2-keto-4-pentenoate hydratase/2-oxohepta-3-ene-1,7-dioic acid hydratase in catechol pathway
VKFGTFEIDGKALLCIVDKANTTIWPLNQILGEDIDFNMLVDRFVQLRPELSSTGSGRPLSGAVLLAPITRPRRNIFCVGKNYRDHAREFTSSGFDSSAKNRDEAIPDAPIIFTKPPESVIGPNRPIIIPAVSASIDYEAELAVVIGKRGRGISRNDAYKHVWGYTIINDVTARDWQARHKQWFLGKSFDTFCPMGPFVVTADELDPENLNIKCWVNGELRQSANTRDLIFDIPSLIETISAGITLYPGDVIATGTPAGVGIGFSPARYLVAGDEVRIDIDGIGSLLNGVAS